MQEERLLETGGSVKNALPLLGDGPFFVLNGDGLWRDGRDPNAGAAWKPPGIPSAWTRCCCCIRSTRRSAAKHATAATISSSPTAERAIAARPIAAPYFFASVSVCDARLFDDSPEARSRC